MAPQKDDKELHDLLIASEEEQQPSRPSEQSHLLSDPLDVLVVQPEVNPGSPIISTAAGEEEGKVISNNGLNGNRKKKGVEVPVNCPHLETALFYFGIAGMIVSVLMLLQHIVSNLISSYY